VAEAFELAHEAAPVSIGVLGLAAVEELLAEVVVGTAAVEHLVGGGEDLVGGAPRIMLGAQTSISIRAAGARRANP